MILALKWIIIFLSLLNAGHMTFDGLRALILGDYIRPKSGEYAGQLGPWTKLAERLGIDPMSALMKSVFVVFGIIGLVLTIAFILDLTWSWSALLIYNIAASWNLYFGTASSVIQILLLILLRSLM
jgi:hypothetical protein